MNTTTFQSLPFADKLRGLAVQPGEAPGAPFCRGRRVREQATVAVEMGLDEVDLLNVAKLRPGHYDDLLVAVGIEVPK